MKHPALLVIVVLACMALPAGSRAEGRGPELAVLRGSDLSGTIMAHYLHRKVALQLMFRLKEPRWSSLIIKLQHKGKLAYLYFDPKTFSDAFAIGEAFSRAVKQGRVSTVKAYKGPYQNKDGWGYEQYTVLDWEERK